MGEPERVSLTSLGLVALDGLRCPQGDSHHVSEGALKLAAANGGGAPKCLKCGEPVRLQSARDLANL